MMTQTADCDCVPGIDRHKQCGKHRPAECDAQELLTELRTVTEPADMCATCNEGEGSHTHTHIYRLHHNRAYGAADCYEEDCYEEKDW